MDYDSLKNRCAFLADESVPLDKRVRQKLLGRVEECIALCGSLDDNGPLAGQRKIILDYLKRQLCAKRAELLKAIAED